MSGQSDCRSGGGRNGKPAGPDDDAQILNVQGELDLATADILHLRARAAINGHVRLLLLDLTGLSFCDACGLGALVRIANDADAAGCRYGLIALQPSVAKIMRITGLDKRLQVFATIDETCTGPYQEFSAGNPPLEAFDVVLPRSHTRSRHGTDRRRSAN